MAKRKTKRKQAVKKKTGDTSIVGVKRDKLGRVLPGSCLNPKGNLHMANVPALKSAMYKAVSPDDMMRIMSAMREKAANGDVEAARLVLDRLLGKPEQKIEIDDGPNRSLSELRAAVLARLVDSPQSITSIMDRLPEGDKRNMLKRVVSSVSPSSDDTDNDTNARPATNIDSSGDDDDGLHIVD